MRARRSLRPRVVRRRTRAQRGGSKFSRSGAATRRRRAGETPDTRSAALVGARRGSVCCPCARLQLCQRMARRTDGCAAFLAFVDATSASLLAGTMPLMGIFSLAKAEKNPSLFSSRPRTGKTSTEPCKSARLCAKEEFCLGRRAPKTQVSNKISLL